MNLTIRQEIVCNINFLSDGLMFANRFLLTSLIAFNIRASFV